MSSAATTNFRALGTTAQLTLADRTALPAAAALMRTRLDELDRAASRFRPDSELMMIQATAGLPRRTSGLLAGVVHSALAAARMTDGAVDPTVGAALNAAGYDRDFSLLADHVVKRRRPGAVPGWASVRFDPRRRLLELPAGVELDVGATAKALIADRIARELRSRTGSATLVSLGGDVAVAGGAWDIGIADHHGASRADQVVRIGHGGLATSSTTVRRWRADRGEAHHIIDPATGEPADSPWRTVSVAARSCLLANTASTAAIVLGERAPAWLAEHGLAARLVRADGSVVRVAGWPA